jgi:hypothetical protein
MAAAAALQATLDHLVVAAATLADGIEFVAERLGAVPHPGGRHAEMGTHNALLRLGPRAYLEIIAIDPQGTRPARPRWFGLDDIALQAELAESPRLIHWVARTDDIDACTRAGIAPGPVHALSRGTYRWRITVPDDGALPAGGVLPTLIQWDVAAHPADVLPESNVCLVELAATPPDPNAIRATLTRLGLERDLRVTFDRVTRLCAMLRTPNGLVTLAS